MMMMMATQPNNTDKDAIQNSNLATIDTNNAKDNNAKDNNAKEDNAKDDNANESNSSDRIVKRMGEAAAAATASKVKSNLPPSDEMSSFAFVEEEEEKVSGVTGQNVSELRPFELAANIRKSFAKEHLQMLKPDASAHISINALVTTPPENHSIATSFTTNNPIITTITATTTANTALSTPSKEGQLDFSQTSSSAINLKSSSLAAPSLVTSPVMLESFTQQLHNNNNSKSFAINSSDVSTAGSNPVDFNFLENLTLDGTTNQGGITTISSDGSHRSEIKKEKFQFDFNQLPCGSVSNNDSFAFTSPSIQYSQTDGFITTAAAASSSSPLIPSTSSAVRIYPNNNNNNSNSNNNETMYDNNKPPPEDSWDNRGRKLNRLLTSTVATTTTAATSPGIVDDKSSSAENEKKDILKYPTDVESDVESPKVGSLWDNAELDSSDAESVDGEINDPFQHSVVFTEEEMALTIRNKLLRMQNLYVREYRKIISNMKERQREYLTLMKKEKELYGPLLKPKNPTDREQRKYQKLKALSQYQKYGNGPETLLFKKMIERKKAATSNIYSRSRIFNKCVYTEGGMRCNTKVVPGSKYCLKHILKDQSQVLFRACAVKKDDFVCEEPVDNIFQNTKCPLHRVVADNPIQQQPQSSFIS